MMFSDVKRGLCGQLPLYKVFWIYGVSCSIVLAILVVSFIFLSSNLFGLKGVEPTPEIVWRESVSFLAFYFLISLPYNIWKYVSYWQCAFNCKKEFWGYLTRIYVVFGTLLILLQVLKFGIDLVGDLKYGPIYAANEMCHEQKAAGKFNSANCVNDHWLPPAVVNHK